MFVSCIHTPAKFISQIFLPWDHPLRISISESVRKTMFVFQNLISENEVTLWKTAVALCLSYAQDRTSST